MASSDQLRGLLRRAEAVALAAVAALALLFHATLPARLPAAEDHAAAAAAVAQEKQPGDVVLLHPWWTERARLAMPEDVPVLGWQGSDASPLERAPRVWVLSQPDLPRAGMAAFWDAFRPGRTPLGEERRFGTLRLQPFRNGRFRPTLFSAEALGQARAYLESAPGVKKADCAPERNGFRCPGSPARAAVEWREVLFEPRRCLYLFPPGGADRLVVEYPAGAPASDRLSLEAGLIWERGAYTNANLRTTFVGVDGEGGETLAQVSLAPGEEGFHRALRPAFAGGPLKVWIRAEVAESREVCADLLAQGPEAGGGT